MYQNRNSIYFTYYETGAISLSVVEQLKHIGPQSINDWSRVLSCICYIYHVSGQRVIYVPFDACEESP